MDLSLDRLLKYKWPLYRISSWSQEYPRGVGVLQLLDQLRTFGILKPFLAHSLELIGYNEGKRKKGSFVFIFSGQCIRHDIVFALLVNDLIIISKELGHPFLLLLGGNALFQKVLEALMVCLNLEALPQEIQTPQLNDMQNHQHFFFHKWVCPNSFQTVAC
jgi:hypothetical protein